MEPAPYGRVQQQSPSATVVEGLLRYMMTPPFYRSKTNFLDDVNLPAAIRKK
jgi:predicted SPOUT superfamily RNA methylase MTH1